MALVESNLGHRLQINGIDLEAVLTRSYQKTPILDNRGRYLYTHFSLEVGCIYNPALTTYERKPPGSFRYSTGKIAPETEEAIRQHLELPQRKIIYRIGDVDLINTPAVGNPARYIDANNGPICKVARVTKVHGSKTFQVDVQVETWISEVGLQNSTQTNPCLISNNWEMAETLDSADHYRVVRTIRGRALFRTDRLYELGKVPDDFRSSLLHPIPQGFRRDTVEITATEEGNELLYVVTDREVKLSIKAAGVVNIRGTHSVEAKSVDFLTMGGNAIGAAADIAMGEDSRQRAEERRRQQTNPGRPPSRVGQAVQAGRSVVGFLNSSFPGIVHQIQVEVFGTTTTNHRTLSYVAHRVLAQQLNGATQAAYGFLVTETRDLMDNYVAVSCMALEGAIARAARILATGGTGTKIPNTTLVFPTTEGVTDNIKDASGDIAVRDAVSQTGTGQGPNSPPGNGQCRGAYLAALAAQVLSDPSQVLTVPTQPRNRIASNPQ